MNFYRQRSFPQALLLRRTAGERQLRVIPQGGPTMTNLKQVAELAGVSASTVSRALNGKSYVNEATRQKVLEAV